MTWVDWWVCEFVDMAFVSVEVRVVVFLNVGLPRLPFV
jgi:hypothetical protein